MIIHNNLHTENTERLKDVHADFSSMTDLIVVYSNEQSLILFFHQAKEYLANPEAFAVAAAPDAEEAAAPAQEAAKEKAEEEEEESEGDMVSMVNKNIYSNTDWLWYRASVCLIRRYSLT